MSTAADDTHSYHSCHSNIEDNAGAEEVTRIEVKPEHGAETVSDACGQPRDEVQDENSGASPLLCHQAEVDLRSASIQAFNTPCIQPCDRVQAENGDGAGAPVQSETALQTFEIEPPEGKQLGVKDCLAGIVWAVNAVIKYFWGHKSLILYPADIVSDGFVADKHFRNGHLSWGVFTVLFMILPYIVYWQNLKYVFTSLKYAIADFRYRFLGDNCQRIRKKELHEQQIIHDGFTVYFEDMPQLILQVYILWKTPVQCLNFEWDDGLMTYASIAIGILSIAATVVPFAFEDNTDDDDEMTNCFWDLLQIVPGNKILFCTFFLVLPKLLLFSWTVSVLKWYSLLFIVPIGMILLCINAWIGGEGILLRTIKDILGYNGRTTKRLLPSVILLSSFLIPLSLSLHVSVNSPFYSKEDYFGIFPSDPFPSSTICFTNSSTVLQEEMWGNLTTSWSPTCNVTFTAQPCSPQVKERTEIILSCSLVFMCLGLALVVFIAPNLRRIVSCCILVVGVLLVVGVIAGIIAAFIFHRKAMDGDTTSKNMVIKACGADDDDISDFETIVKENPDCVTGVIFSPGFLFSGTYVSIAVWIFLPCKVGFFCCYCARSR